MVNKSVVTRADGVRAVVDSAHAPAGAEAVNFVLVSENGHVVTHSAWGIPIAHWRGRRGRARGTGHPCTNSCQPRGVPTRANPAPRWHGFTTHSYTNCMHGPWPCVWCTFDHWIHSVCDPPPCPSPTAAVTRARAATSRVDGRALARAAAAATARGPTVASAPAPRHATRRTLPEPCPVLQCAMAASPRSLRSGDVLRARTALSCISRTPPPTKCTRRTCAALE